VNGVLITVLKRTANPDLIENYAGDAVRETRLLDPLCDQLIEGQTFRLTDPSEMPEGFCPWAWSDIHKEILAIAGGADFRPWIAREGLAIACCTDAFRPVCFKIEREEGDAD